MARFVMLYQNYADAAVLGGGSWRSTLPIANLKNEDIGKVARSTDPLNASTIITADLGAVRSVGGVALGPTNISPGATFRVRAFSDAGYSATVYDSGTRSVAGALIDWSSTANWLAWEDPGFWYGIPDVFDRDAIPVWLVEILSSDVTARYWKIEAFDAGNGDGYVEFGRLLIGRAFRPSLNYGYGDNGFGTAPLFDVSESLGGKRTFFDRGLRRTLRVSWGDLPETELFGAVFRIAMLGVSRQVFVVPDPDDSTHFQKRSFLATLKTPPAIAQASFLRGTTAIDCEEVL